MATTSPRVSVPRQSDDYTREAAEARRDFLDRADAAPRSSTSAPTRSTPSVLPGNIEHFTGVAQVPLGIAGPLLVDGEHAQGEFYVPMATAEGTLVASYNRGMKLLHAAGGVKTTIMDDRMQRAPAFLFESAREARAFGEWLDEHFDEIREVAESTTKSGRLQDIEQYSASRILYTRFNYTTGDAAGQNMTGKATQAACHWILEQYPEIDQFFLEGNFATDKKSSQINMLRTRGKRVVAEATIPDALFKEVMNSSSRADVPGAPGLQPRRLHVRRQQQRRPLRQRHHRDVHRHRARTSPTSPSPPPPSPTPSCARTATTTTRSRSRR